MVTRRPSRKRPRRDDWSLTVARVVALAVLILIAPAGNYDDIRLTDAPPAGIYGRDAV